MFEGETTIEFSKEAAILMMSQNITDLFKMPLEVTDLEYSSYSGLKLTFASTEFLEQAAAAKLLEKETLDRAMPDVENIDSGTDL